jgi:MSHA pilin protein MshA
MRRVAQQHGFTVIELVVVVTILGILAAFAIPRFISLEAQARAASRDALAGSVRSAAALAHALWLANDRPAAVTMDGVAITMVNGYPDAATIDDALADFAGYGYASSGSTGTFTSKGAEGCTVTYTEASGAHGVPTISVGTGGC